MALLYYWRVMLEVMVLWYFIYMALLFIKGTRTEQLLKGLIIIGLIYVFSKQLKLGAFIWVLERLFPLSVIALLIIFQPEMRRGLARIGQIGINQEDMGILDEMVGAVTYMSSRNIGALIAVERESGLKTYIESGTVIDSKLTKELLSTIFMPGSPLHDGAVIVQRDRIVAGGCLLPLSQESQRIPKSLGTRHRAALGLSEETDAISIVVSEETGGISLATEGKLLSNLDGNSLLANLKRIFYKQNIVKNHLKILSRITPRNNQ